MKKWLKLYLITAILFLASCASIPPEAPELSAQLGSRISSFEAAHTRLLEEYFKEKRYRVDQFIQDIWVPVFAREIFGDQKIDAVWNQVVQSKNPADRLKFITFVGPRLQESINRKRVELIRPLDDLESTIKNKLKTEYDNARGINNTLTAFLQSASKVEENRKRYLEMIGIKNQDIDKVINETDKAVSHLVEIGNATELRQQEIESYRKRIMDIINNLRN